jgi:phosphoglycolate phosphatase
MVGDSINDVQAGQRANIASIACMWGYGNRAELAGAATLAHTPQELLAALTEGVR